MVYIFLALIFYTAVIVIGTIASRNANTNFVAAISNLIAAIIPLAVILPLLNKGLLAHTNKLGIIATILSGIAVALFTMAMVKSYSINKVAIVAPIVFGGSIFLSAILSYFFFKEKITLFQGVGLAFLAIGLIFVT
ncbi:MAG: EamA family transporter, partial [Candidatus Levybacteria bacterium]|nr:EamA family transporter [Candidatus Levybacteria bacterium]